MTLQVVWSRAPEVPSVKVLSVSSLCCDGDDSIALSCYVSPAQPVPGVDVQPGVSPGPERVRSQPGLGSSPGLTEAAGVTIEEVIPAVSGEQDRIGIILQLVR